MITIENFFVSSEVTFNEIESIPKGFRCFFKSKSSIYFTNENKTAIIRKSDHWGTNIRQCNWFLGGYPKGHCGEWVTQLSNPWKLGITTFNDFIPI